MTAASVLNVPLDEQDVQMLSAIANAKGLSNAQLAAEAIHQYVAYNTAFQQLISARLDEAERGEFASDAEVKATFARAGIDYNL